MSIPVYGTWSLMSCHIFALFSTQNQEYIKKIKIKIIKTDFSVRMHPVPLTK